MDDNHNNITIAPEVSEASSPPAEDIPQVTLDGQNEEKTDTIEVAEEPLLTELTEPDTMVESISAFKKFCMSKILSVILICLGSLLTVVCVLIPVLWGFSVKENYLIFWQMIRERRIVQLVIMAFMLLFMVLMLIHVIRSIVSLIRKDHEPQFALVSTLWSFFVFSLLTENLLSYYAQIRETPLLISYFEFMPWLLIPLGMTAVYALLRLFRADFQKRIWSFGFACAAIAVALILFWHNAGDFASFVHRTEGVELDLAEMNVFNYMTNAFTKSPMMETPEYAFFTWGREISINHLRASEEIILVFGLQILPILVADLLPYASLSLLGYLIYGLTGKQHVQYHHLHACKQVSIAMLVASLMSIAATVGLFFVCRAAGAVFFVRFNYVNAIVTVALCVVMIILTAMPWNIYGMSYKRRYKAYRESDGGR